ncbi:DEAD/DEAH box helicase [Schaalia sp. lx-100]|uniref:DEAD/DEAH box helicase n=1 Tax=Schaalia sp. lx-100 TaxID=2899081 RepID=UPI001E5C0D20|nr:DEAD/DEAH box helicase [Schaalia sp. lx-100]MCD4557187.1 DEAD/DEAH box helicase [Schaalia sp. lx-100]
MRFEPHGYQQVAIRHLVDCPQAALFLDMGLGKTAITLTAIAQLMHDMFEVSRVLVIGPLRIARDTWPEECAKWDHLSGLTMAVAVGDVKARKAALGALADVTVINRENVPWLVEYLDGAWPFDMVVLDESASFKNHGSCRFRALKRVRSKIARMVALTGTPAANGLLDLWAQYRLLDGGERLGRFITRFRNDLFTPDKRGGSVVYSWKPREGAEEVIYERIGDITLSMRAADMLDLPEVSITDHLVTLPERVRGSYGALKRDLCLQLEGGQVDAMNAAALAGKLLQAASGSVYGSDGETLILHDEKLSALNDLIEASNGANVLVAYWYRSDRERLLEGFPGAVELKSAAHMAAWKRGEVNLGLIHPASAGHGLNLQSGGHILIWYTLPWSLELYQQTNARLHRQGQTHPVSIHRLIARDTIDVQVARALEDKNATQAALVDALTVELNQRGMQ